MPLTIDAPFFVYQISDNISHTPEGFLICHDVPVARTGTQKYMGREIGQDADQDKVYTVYRLPEDVFDDATLASTEGKPVTDDHPPDAVTPENSRLFVGGHIQNVKRRGIYMIGDLMITDPDMIAKVTDKAAPKREISAGYTAEYHPYKDGYRQANIRINHIAIVDKGRAGPRVRIKDELPKDVKSNRRSKPMSDQTLKAKLLAAFVKDEATTDQDIEKAMALLTTDSAAIVAEAVAEIKPVNDDAGVLKKLLGFMTKDAAAATTEAKPEKPLTADDVKSIIADALKDLKPVKDKKAKDEDEEEVEKMIAEDADDDEDEKKKDTADADEDDDEKKKETADADDDEDEKKETKDAAIKEIIKALGPVAAKNKEVRDALVKFRKDKKASISANGGLKDVLTLIQKATHDREAVDATPDDDSARGRAIMRQYGAVNQK